MWAAVIPAYNESGRIGRTLNNLSSLPLDKIFVIANGCTDKTVNEVLAMPDTRIELIIFPEKLGIDIPRAIGAKRCLDLGATGVLFVDGDMIGHFNEQLLELIQAIKRGWDLALTNCYPYITYRQPLCLEVLQFRANLNRKLKLFPELGIASPSHGPHAVSQHLLKSIPLEEFAVPPVMLALAKEKNLTIGVGASIPHSNLNSRLGDDYHAEMVAATIIGDCLEAICLAEGKPRSRFYQGEEIVGYNQERKWELLQEYLENPIRST